MFELKTVGLFAITALAEVVGCYLPYLWLREGKSIWLLIPSVLSLAAFVWLLTLHPTAVGRVYAAYGGVYVTMAILWLWAIEGIRPTTWDLLGTSVALLGRLLLCLRREVPRLYLNGITSIKLLSQLAPSVTLELPSNQPFIKKINPYYE